MAVKEECQKHFFFAFYAVGIKSVAIYVQLKITFDKKNYLVFSLISFISLFNARSLGMINIDLPYD